MITETDPPRSVSLVEIDAGNWREAAAVTPIPSQERFVAPIAYYLCLCFYGPDWSPLGIAVDGRIVGHVMWAVDEADGSYWIGGLVVDAAHQRRGIGRAAVRALMDRFVATAPNGQVALSYEPENEAARALYAGLGFVETGELEGEEVVARRSWRTAPDLDPS